MLESWPEIYKDVDLNKADDIDSIIEIIENTRTIKTENNIKPSKELNIIIDGLNINESLSSILYRMTKLNIIDSTDKETVVRPTKFGKVSYIMEEIVDKQSEIEKIEKELVRLQGEIDRSNKMLNNPNFVIKAAKEKVEEEKNKLINYQNSYDTLSEKLKEYE